MGVEGEASVQMVDWAEALSSAVDKRRVARIRSSTDKPDRSGGPCNTRAQVQGGFLSNSTSSTMSEHLYAFGFHGKHGDGPWFWARVRIGDLRCTQDSCRSTFSCGKLWRICFGRYTQDSCRQQKHYCRTVSMVSMKRSTKSTT